MKQKVDNTATECCKTQHDEKGDVDIAVSIFRYKLCRKLISEEHDDSN